ncbi:MAG: hypothetical protein ACLP8S_23755, partial [Solirubrobacteraceae bacterium]
MFVAGKPIELRQDGQPRGVNSLLRKRVMRLGRDPAVIGTHVLHHLLERSHPGDRVLGELPGECDSAQQLAVDVDRA